MVVEKSVKAASGYTALFIFAVLHVGIVIVAVQVALTGPKNVVWVILEVLLALCWKGFFMVAPNQGKILQLFGQYVGTAKQQGLRYANPFYSHKTISLRVRNFESGKLKVNDATGNPIEIAAVVVWKVVDTAEAYFEVDDYESFVTIQSEAALRNLANHYPYESDQEGVLSLRGDPQQIAEKMKHEVQDRLQKAGVNVIEARISHLAYAPEIAQAMLRKQQASAVLSARRLIVQGAVDMVSDALNSLTEKHNFELDEERKAHMISNLLVVICGDQQSQPVVNVGSLY